MQKNMVMEENKKIRQVNNMNMIKVALILSKSEREK
jgi:hypothetical protein